MAIADTITSMQNHTSNAYNVLACGTDLTGVNKNLSNLKQCIFDSLINSMSNTLNQTWNNLPKITTTPGTTQSINNTIEAPMKIELGANELSQSATPTPSSPQAVHTITGENIIKVCGKNLFDSNNVITTCNINSDGTYANNGDYNTYYIKVEPGQKYTMTTLSSKEWVYNFSTTLPVKTGQGTARNVHTATNETITIPNGCNYLCIRDTILIPKVDIIMVVKGEVAPTTYEPYKGNSYEINLGVENLLPPPINNTQSNNGMTLYTDINNNYKLFGTATGNTTPRGGALTKDYVIKNGDYLHLCNNVTPSGTIQVVGVSSSVTQIFASTINSTNKIIDLSSYAGSTLRYLQFYCVSGASVNTTFTPMILNGISSIKDYTEYGKQIEYCKIGTYEDKFIKTSGKNLINPNSPYTGTSNGVATIYNSSTQALSYSGTLSSSWAYLTNKIDISIPAGNYTFTRTKSLAHTTIIRLYYDNSNYQDITIQENTTSRTATITHNSIAYQVYIANLTSGNQVNETYNVQLENGNITTPTYEPYGKNEWWLKKAIGKVVLDGSETWTADGVRFKTPIPNSINVASRGICYSNYFHYLESGTEEGGCFVYLAQVYLYPTSNITTVEGFKTWLSTHNTIVYYRLETPTYTKIDSEELIGQLEAIKTIKSQNGQTNINQENTDLGFIINTIALEDLS